MFWDIQIPKHFYFTQRLTVFPMNHHSIHMTYFPRKRKTAFHFFFDLQRISIHFIWLKAISNTFAIKNATHNLIDNYFNVCSCFVMQSEMCLRKWNNILWLIRMVTDKCFSDWFPLELISNNCWMRVIKMWAFFFCFKYWIYVCVWLF